MFSDTKIVRRLDSTLRRGIRHRRIRHRVIVRNVVSYLVVRRHLCVIRRIHGVCGIDRHRTRASSQHSGVSNVLRIWVNLTIWRIDDEMRGETWCASIYCVSRG